MQGETRPHAGNTAIGDFTTRPRVLLLAAMAVVVGLGGVAAAWVLLRLIALVTGLVYYGTLSTQHGILISLARLGAWSVLVPVAGSFIVGLMARFGSDKIRGHGIPEALEAILIGESRIAPKVAILKPLSSAISIGTGGPFGAEGPIIMTGGALGSLFAQFFHLTSAERKTLLVAGAAAGMTAIFNTPIAARAARGRATAVRMEAAQLHPRARRGPDGRGGARLRAAGGRPVPASRRAAARRAGPVREPCPRARLRRAVRPADRHGLRGGGCIP